MEIEREAFESWFESRYDAHFMQFALDLDMYADKHTQTCWEAWQAAKAQEAEKLKGCVMVSLNNTTIVAIERMVEQQVEASGITDDVFRLDGEKILNAAVEAQEPAMTENTIRCTNCELEFESDYDLEQNLVDQDTGEIHDGCPTCKTDAYLMDLIKYPDLEPANDL